MKMKKMGFLLMLILGLGAMAACGEKQAPVKDESTVFVNQPTQQSKEEKKTENKDASKEEKEAENQEADAKIDKSLIGTALLDQIHYTMPKSYITKADYEVAGKKSVVTTYFKAGSMRMETKGADGTESIMVYNDKEGITYMYNVGDEFGILSHDDEDDEDGGPGFMSGKVSVSLNELLALENVKEARIERLNGKEVIYVENTETDEGLSTTAKMWYNLKYPIMMQYEVNLGSQNTMKSQVTQLEVNAKIDDKLFDKPAQVEFKDMDAGMDALDDLLDQMDDEDEE